MVVCEVVVMSLSEECVFLFLLFFMVIFELVNEVEVKIVFVGFGLCIFKVQQVLGKDVLFVVIDVVGMFCVIKVEGFVYKFDVGGVYLVCSIKEDVIVVVYVMLCEIWLVEELVDGIIVEFLVGVVKDLVYGFVLIFVVGGILIEFLQDGCFLLVFVSDVEIIEVFLELCIVKQLNGYCGVVLVDMFFVFVVICVVQDYVMVNVEGLEEIEINLLFCIVDIVVVVDVLICCKD